MKTFFKKISIYLLAIAGVLLPFITKAVYTAEQIASDADTALTAAVDSMITIIFQFFTSWIGIVASLGIAIALVWFFIRKVRSAGRGG